jgi:hypothetical protein
VIGAADPLTPVLLLPRNITMNASRFFVSTAVALSTLAVIGCASDRPREVTPAPVVYTTPEPVAIVAPAPTYPVMAQADPSPPVVMRSESPVYVAPAEVITERAPRADRN